MHRRRRGVLLGLAAAAVAAVIAAPAGADGVTALLPDLDPVAPAGVKAIAAADGSGQVFLTFKVGIDNTGAGPLVVRGHRTSTSEPQMSADQVIQLSDGTTSTVTGVGDLVYDREYTRWGFEPYQAYELRAADGSLVGTGPAMNFCLEDNANSSSTVLPGEPSTKVYVGCGKRRSTLLTLDVGISVGWRNQHSAGKKGQMITISGLPSGQYVLVHRVNPAGLISEASTANDTASTRISIAWTSGVTLPKLRIVRSCSDSETC
jgi:hypothetical protein